MSPGVWMSVVWAPTLIVVVVVICVTVLKYR